MYSEIVRFIMRLTTQSGLINTVTLVSEGRREAPKHVLNRNQRRLQ